MSRWNHIDQDLKKELQANLCKAPCDLFAAYQRVATQATVSFVLVIGWILTSQFTQNLVKTNRSFFWVSVVGTTLFGVTTMAILWGNCNRSELAFREIEELIGGEQSKPTADSAQTHAKAYSGPLACYRIAGGRKWATIGLILLLTLSVIAHLSVIRWGN